MSLFFRRSIQEMLNHCSYFLTKQQLQNFVEQLNGEDQRSLHAQWELALLYALNHSGVVEHEKDFKKKPDVRWISRDLSCEFIADVRTVSDDGYEDDNPREFYRHELGRRIRLIGGLESSFFRDEPNYKMEGKNYRDRKVKLLYPPHHEANRLFNQDFLDFVQAIKDNNLQNAQIRLTGPDFDVSIIYQVQNGSTRIGGGNISYTVPYSLKRNPIYRALQDKREQLKKANYIGMRGIILTDGGCDALSRGFRGATGETYTNEKIITTFLDGTKSITFVMLIYPSREQSLYSHLEPLKVKAKLFSNANAEFPMPQVCKNALLDMPRHIPLPKLNGDNAARHLKNGWDGPQKAWYSGTKIETNNFMTKIFISSRSLADLLAQRITPEDFIRINNLASKEGNLFNLWLTQGMNISQVNFEKLSGDDDHIILTYEPDFSVQKYKAPKQGVRTFVFNLWRKTNYFPKKHYAKNAKK